MQDQTRPAPVAERRRTSRALRRVDEMTTRPFIAVLAGGLVVGAWVAIALAGFDDDLQFGFSTVCTGITVVMVFVLQHTQRRQQVTVQLKLNEIVRALPTADDHLIGVEASSDAELVQLGESHLERHAALRDDTEPAP